MISTQPGSTPLASFKILSLEEAESHGSYCSGNDIGRMSLECGVLSLYIHWSPKGLTGLQPYNMLMGVSSYMLLSTQKDGRDL